MPWRGVSFSTFSTGRLSQNNMLGKVLKRLRRHGTPVRAHQRTPEHQPGGLRVSQLPSLWKDKHPAIAPCNQGPPSSRAPRRALPSGPKRLPRVKKTKGIRAPRRLIRFVGGQQIVFLQPHGNGSVRLLPALMVRLLLSLPN